MCPQDVRNRPGGEISISMRRTRAVLIAVGAVTALQFLFTYVPFMEAFFDTRPLSLAQSVQIVAVGVAVLLVIEIEKRLHSPL